jgi:ArsR family transcriptional regulator
MPEDARRLLELIGESTDDPLLKQDLERAQRTIAARRGEGSWADEVAGQMARHYSPGRTWESAARAVVGLCDLGRVLDIASGDGALAEFLAPRASQIVCLDLSPRVVSVGRQRLCDVPNLDFVQGDMHDLPFPNTSFDSALLMHSLCYANDPARVAREAARVLVPGGVLVAVTLRLHAHAEAVAPYGHVQLGFEPDTLRDLFSEAGFGIRLCAVTSRERRSPQFEVVTLHARLEA